MYEGAVIGRYLSGSSPIHRMDARAKLLLSLVLIASVFTAQTMWGLAVCSVGITIFFMISSISLRLAFTSIAPLTFMVVIAALINVFFVQGGAPVVSWGIIHISEAGLTHALFIAWRLVLLLLGASLVTLTTTTLNLTCAFEILLTPLSRIGLPAHELAMMMGIALRFLPQFIAELHTIYRAQTSRGAQLSRGKISTLSALLVPLFTSAFRHAETLSLAMDARCYHGCVGRTRLQPLGITRRDVVAAVVLISMLGAVIATNCIR